MKAVLITLGILAFIGFSIFSWVVGTYNRLVHLRAEVDTQLSQIDTQMQRRLDLVPGLVNSVRGAMKQERGIFEAIAEARTKYAGTAPKTPERLEAATQYDHALARLLVIIENYPQVKSLENVRDLMTQLEGTENRISVARQRYNETVRSYNIAVKSFPGNLLAGMFGFTSADFFAATNGAEKPVEVNLE